MDTAADSLSLVLGYTKALDENNTLAGNLSYVNSSLNDEAAVRSVQDLQSSTYTLSLFFTHATSTFSASGSMGNSNQPGFTGGFASLSTVAQTGSSDAVSIAWSQRWIPAVFDTRVGYDLASSDLNPAAGTDTTSDRSTFSLGTNLTVAQMNHFGLTLAYAMVDAKSPLNGSSDLGEFYTDFTYNMNF
jgi:hypothetical protein